MPPVCQENFYNAPEFLQCHRHLQHDTTMERPEIALVAQQEFMSVEDFRHAMDEWAIVNGFTFFYQNLILVGGLWNVGFKIDTALWAYAHLPGPRFGHDTSNIVEPSNSVFLEDRELPLLKMLDSIWRKLSLEREPICCHLLLHTPWGKVYDCHNIWMKVNSRVSYYVQDYAEIYCSFGRFICIVIYSLFRCGLAYDETLLASTRESILILTSHVMTVNHVLRQHPICYHNPRTTSQQKFRDKSIANSNSLRYLDYYPLRNIVIYHDHTDSSRPWEPCQRQFYTKTITLE